MRAAIDGSLRQRVSHLAARPVREIADGVDRLLRGSGGDQNRFAVEIRNGGRERALDSLDDALDLGEPSGSDGSASQKTVVGIDDRVPAPPQRFDVGAHRFVLPHVVVHGRREHDGAAEREVHGGEEIVRQTLRELAEHVGGGGRDEQQVVLLRHADMLDRTGIRGFGIGGRKHVRDDLAAGQRREREGADELFGGMCQHRLHFMAVPDERAGDIGSFICRDPAAHAENDPHC